MGADGHLIITTRESIQIMLVHFILSWISANDYTCEVIDCEEFMKSTITVTLDEEEVDDENEEDKKKETTKSIDMKNFYDFYKNMLRLIEVDCSRDITEQGWNNIGDDYQEEDEENNCVYYWDNLEDVPNDSLAFYFEDFNRYDSEDLIRRFYAICLKSVKKFKTMFPNFEQFEEMFRDACEEYIVNEEQQIWT